MTMYKAIRETLQSKPTFIKVGDIPKFNRDVDYYDSLFLYNEEQIKLFNEKGTVSGIQDTVTNRIYFDLDSKTDLNQAKGDAIKLIERLEESGITKDNYRIAFSGSKGFNIEFAINKMVTPAEFKAITFKLAKDLKTFDTVINDSNRVLRCLNSKHPGSGLYKIPLLKSELLNSSIDEIKAMAKKPRNTTSIKGVVEASKLGDYTVQNEPIKVKASDNIVLKRQIKDILSIPIKERMFTLDDSRWALHNGFFSSGERSNALLCLASTYKNNNVDRERALSLCQSVIELQSEINNVEPFSYSELEKNIINQVYSPQWRGGQFSLKDTTSWLYIYSVSKGIEIQKTLEEKATKLGDLGGAAFTKYARSFFETRILTGLKPLDDIMPICAGSNVGIVGAAGSGKTALVLNILQNAKEQNFISVFASLDLTKSRLYEKLLYKVTNGKYTREEIYQKYIEGNGKELDDLVHQEFPNVYIYSKSGPTVKEVGDYIKQIEMETGKPVRLLLVDYFERLQAQKTNDDNSASKEIANGIQDLLSDFPELTAITLVQPNKIGLMGGGGPDKPILSYLTIKGSSFLFQSFRQIFSLWRPFYHAEWGHYDKFMEMAILKNDLGELDRFVFGWQGKTGTISEIDDLQLREYNRCMKERADTEKMVKDGDDDL